MAAPLYGKEIVYLRESAAIGRIEAVRITGIHMGKDGWLYTISASMSPPSEGMFMDRRSLVSTAIVYFTEDEFITLQGAYDLAIDNAQRILNQLIASRDRLFPTEVTSGTD